MEPVTLLAVVVGIVVAAVVGAQAAKAAREGRFRDGMSRLGLVVRSKVPHGLQIKGDVDGRHVVATRLQSRSGADVGVTIQGVGFGQRSTLRVRRRVKLDVLEMVGGAPPFQTGDAGFDAEFAVDGSDPAHVVAAFRDPALQAATRRLLRGRVRVVDLGADGELTVDITDVFTIPAREADALVEDALRFVGALDGAAPRAALPPPSAEVVSSSSGAPVGVPGSTRRDP